MNREPKKRSFVWQLGVSLLLFSTSSALAEANLDWTFWRGPQFNGQSPETGLVDDFDPAGGEGSNVSWKRDDLGGRSTPIVMDGLLYTLVRSYPGTNKEGERVVCLDATTGKTIWENSFNVYLSDVPDTRVGWSSVTGDPSTGLIYAQGVCGHFQCIDAKTGKTKWYIPLHERFGLLSTYGGRTNYPVICDDLVITSAIVIGWGDHAKPAHQFIGFDKLTGDVVWFNGTRPLPYDTTYSGPTLAVLNGQKALVIGSGDGGVWAIQPRTGKPIWHFDLARRGLNSPPLVDGGVVYAGNGEENMVGTSMGAIVAIDALQTGDVTEAGEKWRVEEVMAGRTQPLKIGNHLWVFDDRAKLLIYDANTGEQIGQRISLGTQMRSSPLVADGKVYAATANGRWYILTPDERKGATTLKKGRFPSGEGTEASPICSHGRVYIQTTGALYCLKDDSKTPSAASIAELAQESPVSEDQKVAHLQVVPADALMRPGDQRKLSVRAYNAKGQRLAEPKNVSFTVNGLGTVDSSGTYNVGSNGAHQAATIVAMASGVRGEARVRVVPPLPWKFDFESTALTGGVGEPPITWVGCRYRHVVREKDGNKYMVKITTIPKGTRSRCWMGQSDLSDYTIQADVMGSISDDKMPDIGLIAQGYTLDLQGASQKLQIRSWVTQLRMATTIDFAWSPDTWYTSKFMATTKDGKAILKGKVWPKGTAEPSEWTIEAEDESPNYSGSPGLYGNAKDAEIALDNILVTPNE